MKSKPWGLAAFGRALALLSVAGLFLAGVLSRRVPPIAFGAIGTVWIASDRFCAVTTTSATASPRLFQRVDVSIPPRQYSPQGHAG